MFSLSPPATIKEWIYVFIVYTIRNMGTIMVCSTLAADADIVLRVFPVVSFAHIAVTKDPILNPVLLLSCHSDTLPCKTPDVCLCECSFSIVYTTDIWFETRTASRRLALRDDVSLGKVRPFEDAPTACHLDEINITVWPGQWAPAAHALTTKTFRSSRCVDIKSTHGSNSYLGFSRDNLEPPSWN